MENLFAVIIFFDIADKVLYYINKNNAHLTHDVFIHIVTSKII